MATPLRRTISETIPFRQESAPFYMGRYPISARPENLSVPPVVQIRALDRQGRVSSAISDGATLNLSELPDPFNIEAVSSNAGDTGSVHFLLERQGTVIVDRFENSAPFTMFAESAVLVLESGDYTLTVTPNDAASLAGDDGPVFVVSFTVNDDRPAPTVSAQIATPESGFCLIDENDGTCNATSTHEAVVNDASGPVTYSWSVNNSAFTFIGSTNQQSVQLQTISDMSQIGTITLTVSDGVNIITESRAISHTHSRIGGTAEGFTQVTPSADTRVIHVANDGDDSNDGSENEPVSSISHAINLMRPGHPDHVLLKRGSRWRLSSEALNNIQNGRSASEPAVFGYYGDSGARPILESTATLYRQDRRDVRHIWFIGIHFYGYAQDPDHPEHDPSARGATMRFITRFTDILVEDCKFEFSEMTVQTFGGDRPTGFMIRRNIYSGSYDHESSFSRSARPSNVFTHGVDGQHLEENVFDFGGWHPTVPGAGANQLAHNVYMQWQSDGNTSLFINNISVRGASHGIQMRSGGLAQDNFFARNSIGLLMGYDFDNREPPAGTIAHCIDNVITEGISMQAKGIDSCQTGNVCTTALWGLNVVVNSDADFQAHGNIVANSVPEDIFRSAVALNFGFRNGRTDFPNTNNIAYNWRNSEEGAGPNYRDPSRSLARYNAEILGGNESFDEFMNTVKNRPPGTWDERYTARAINAWIREGFEIVGA